MAYAPFKDYLGLSGVAWQQPRDFLDNIMRPPSCNRDDGIPAINCDLFAAADPLDIMRSNAKEDFSNNGVDVAMDEVDVFKSHLRHREVVPALATQPAGLGCKPVEEVMRRKSKKQKKVCVFCRNNGEAETVYRSHVLKDHSGRTTCPILRRYNCPICGSTGDNAHTIKYCPRNDSPLSPALSLLMNSDFL